MSASKEKKVRARELSAGTNKKQNAADEKAKQERKFQRGLIIAVVIVAAAALAAIIINTGMFGLFYNAFTALKVGDTGYSAAEFNIFYRNAYNSLYSAAQETYGGYASYFIDTESEEWKQQVYDEAIKTAKDITALYDEAVASGYTLTEEDRAAIDEQLSAMEMYASLSNYSTDGYITAMYGRGVNRKTLESILPRLIIAQSWADRKLDSMTYTTEQLDSYYAEHADEYDYISYYYYTIGTNNEAFESLDGDEAKKAAAHDAAAEIIAGATDADSFTENVKAFQEDAAPGEQYLPGSRLGGDQGEWLLDASRKAGDATVIDTDSGSIAMLFIARDGNDYHLQNMRHILIETESEADDNGSYIYTDEAGEAAKAKIEEIMAEYEANPTEENFAALANQYSEDSGSNQNGGLYENIYHRQMVTSINDYLFDASRVPGDVAVLFGESGYYQGWHLVYYVGEGPVYKEYLSKNALQNVDYESYIEALTASYEVTTGTGLKFASLT